jgi:hypothetical protein
VVPRAGVDELVDVVIGSDVIDVLLAVELGLVAVDRRSCRGRRCAGQLGEVVMAP